MMFPIAKARGVTRCPDSGLPVVSFECVGNIVVRYRITEESVLFLIGALGDLSQIGTRSHSDNSSGNPTLEVSTPLEGVKV